MLYCDCQLANGALNPSTVESSRPDQAGGGEEVRLDVQATRHQGGRECLSLRQTARSRRSRERGLVAVRSLEEGRKDEKEGNTKGAELVSSSER